MNDIIVGFIGLLVVWIAGAIWHQPAGSHIEDDPEAGYQK